MTNTQLQQKSVLIMTYIYSKGPSAYLLTSWSISDWFPVVYYRYINSNQYNYEQSFITYILNVLLQQAPTLNWASETTRSPDGGTHSSRSPSMRRYDYITDTCKHTQSRTAINKPARLYIHTPNVTNILPNSSHPHVVIFVKYVSHIVYL